MAYADYYEQALTNGVLSIQRGRDPGVIIYMPPLHHGGSKAQSYHGWRTKYDSFGCCYGTGIEPFSKLGDSICFENEGHTPALYIIQYVSSSLDWKTTHISLNQKVERVVSWDQCLQVTTANKMGGSDENFPGVIRPSNILGILRARGDKFPTSVGHSRRALNAIIKNIIGNPPYPSAVHKRGVLTKKNAISNKKPDVPVHRPITRKFDAQMACKQQLLYIKV
ncbi:Uncharacterized protein Fot_56980 [Forsythia ovata]|uniref:Non-reducing end beta-L-arabinofuranosidase-like GH127 catalytic domain-containing protein n=1 Tax=Forsythia ovata TaxID=205694 RepID=A0ABD1P0B4_9LAMI